MYKMKRKLLVILVTVIMASALLPQAALAASPPATVSAPENFGVANYNGSAVHCTMSAPDDLRALIGRTEEERGYKMTIWAQIDFRTDNGNWHFASDWDSPDTYRKYALSAYNALIGGEYMQYLGHVRLVFQSVFPAEKNVPVAAAYTSWDWYKSHSITFRARFAVDFGNKNIVFSGWSSEYVLSDKSKMDYRTILNTHAPTLTSSRLEENKNNKRPYVVLALGRHPGETEKFNAASGNSMRIEVWMRKSGDKDFKPVGDAPFGNEVVKLDVSSYYGNNVKDYAAAAYEVKVRYKIDERAYQQSGAAALNWLYSPYSNTLSYGMPAWSAASNWAAGELKKADDYGLIPDILKGADLTKPITREEFAKMAVLLYEKTTGQKAVAAAKNPFTDTRDPEILKAFELGITTGVTATEFAPKELTNRQQVATMLSRATRAMAPDGDFSTEGAPVFSDEKEIDSWAKEHVKFMSKIEVIKGTNGRFMPKATTTAQQASGYATTTREQSLAMGVRIYEKYK